MAPEKQTVEQTTRSTPSPMEEAQNKLDYERNVAIYPELLKMDKSSMALGQALIEGRQNLPGFYGQIGAGIGPELTGEMTASALRDIMPSFQQSGILDSGTSASVAARVSGDIRRSVGEFNIGNLFNLLNLASGTPAQVQAPIAQNAAQLNAKLMGLRTTTGSQTTTSMNPFMKSLQSSLGTGLGSAPFAIAGGFLPKSGLSSGLKGGASV